VACRISLNGNSFRTWGCCNSNNTTAFLQHVFLLPFAECLVRGIGEWYVELELVNIDFGLWIGSIDTFKTSRVYFVSEASF
jgi:hypothetical protein